MTDDPDRLAKIAFAHSFDAVEREWDNTYVPRNMYRDIAAHVEAVVRAEYAPMLEASRELLICLRRYPTDSIITQIDKHSISLQEVVERLLRLHAEREATP